VLVDAVAEHLVVEHCLLDRDRQHLLGAEADRVLELLRIVDPGDLEDADADAVVGDPEADALPRQFVLPEERAQLLGEELWLAQLAAYDETVVELLTGDLDQLRGAVVDDAGGRKLRAADLEADDLLRTLRPGAVEIGRASCRESVSG